MDSIEFYSTPDGGVMIKELGKPVRELSDSDRSFIEEFLSILRNRYPEAFAKLSEIYSTSDRNVVYYEFRITKRFIKCNFGEYDQSNFDIDENGSFKFEEVKCPLRGECKYEGCICKPTLNNTLTPREMDVLRSIAAGNQTNDIADNLSISPATVNRHRENIKAKINVHSVAQMTAYFLNNNLK